MSVYSTDSLEVTNEIILRSSNFSREENGSFNIVSMTHLANAPRDLAAPLHLKPTAALNHLSRKQGIDNDLKATDGDTIIANGKFRQEDLHLRQRSVSSKNEKRDATNKLKNNNLNRLMQEEGSSLRQRMASDCRKRSSRPFPAKQTCPKETATPMKPDKKLGNVLSPKIQQARKPRSYLELYHRRFSEPQYNARSPEGSTLSVFGDSQQERLSDKDTCLPGTPRDDCSELSFYRRIIEGFTDCTIASARSSEILHQHVSEDRNGSHSQHAVKGNAINNKSKSLGYRPYTIEEYKTLPIPNLDRSLGPDITEMQAKREWLMRRRSYGNSVSAHNRQRIVLQAQKMKGTYREKLQADNNKHGKR